LKLENFDNSVQKALRDSQIITPDGKYVGREIEEVKTFIPTTHVDQRGKFFEIWKGSKNLWQDPVDYSYMFSIKVNQKKVGDYI
jgi:hypothetical protein